MLAYPSPTPYRTRSVGLSTYVIKSFSSFCVSFHQPFLVFSFQSFFTSPPPGSCHPLFTFHYPFTILTSFSQLVSLPACSLCCLCCSVVVRVSWTDGVCGRSAALLTHGQHHTRTQAIKHVCGGFPPDKARKPRERFVLQPPYPLPVPVVVETINQMALSPLSCGLCVPPTTWAPCTAVDIKQSHEPCL